MYSPVRSTTGGRVTLGKQPDIWDLHFFTLRHEVAVQDDSKAHSFQHYISIITGGVWHNIA